MDDKTRELITRLFIADVDGLYPSAGGYCTDEDGNRITPDVCEIVSDLRQHLTSTGQWNWKVDAEPLLNAEAK